MMDNEKVNRWIEMADDDLITAKAMLRTRRLLPCAFYCHITVEKALKAVVSLKEDAPPIHSLLILADRGGIHEDMSDEQRELLGTLAPMNIRARYPERKDEIAASLTRSDCAKMVKGVEKLLCWIKTRL